MCVDVWSVAGLRRSDQPHVGHIRHAVRRDGAVTWRLLLQLHRTAGLRSVLLKAEPAHSVLMPVLLPHYNDPHVLLRLRVPRQQTASQARCLFRRRDAGRRRCSKQ